MSKSTLIIIWTIAAVLIVWYFVYYDKIKDEEQKEDERINAAGYVNPGGDCVEYNKNFYERDKDKIHEECYANWLVPIVGIGLYMECIDKKKAKLPVYGQYVHPDGKLCRQITA